MSKRNKWTSGLTLLLSSALVLSACGGGKQEGGTSGAGSESSDDELKPVELSWYYPQWSTQPDLQSVEDAVNKITKEKINATIKMNPIDGGSYSQKLNTMVASNEKFDIAWTSFWSFDYAQNARKGAFAELDDAMLDKYAPNLREILPDVVWQALKVDGKTYGILNYQTITNREGFLIQKKYVDKYGIDPEAIKEVKDMEPFYEKIKADEPDTIPFSMTRGGKFTGMKISFNNMELISNHALIGIYRDDAELRVVDVATTPEYKEYLDLMHSWYKKGLINQDAPMLKSDKENLKVGKVASFFHNVLKPGREQEEKTSFGGNDVVAIPITDPFVGTDTIIQSMQAISKTSENPERALMFLDLLNSDPELLNLVAFGIEDKHYTKIGDNTVRTIPDGGYDPNQTWVFGNGFISYLREGQEQEIRDQTLEENESADSSPILGFAFDPELVLTEIANIQAVGDQYGPPLNTGAVDPDEKLEEFITKRKTAGIDKIVEEAQRQLDEWIKLKQ
ncbi:ABC transporter substrate-binding protein [Paenibacillus senegalensis]|uniref:ABC transporter substrate-binding protein n=1 Tax=Paenibacillus senegalensis TaxID=1465766 RepID=UPI000289AB3C|nr:ABC transporter substrate-binding protein [Paenibacillus senegalensis]